MIELDCRINNVIQNCTIYHKRCTFILTGSQASYNVPVLFSARKYDINYDAKILWCFKRDTPAIKRGNKNNRKFEKSCKKMNVNNEYFENFAFSYDINWCHYNDSDNILGTTFDACVLQDFDSLTPNKIAKIIEVVKGGGMIVFLLPSISKISDFGSLPMDAHKKYQTFAYEKVNCRFNYRFFYSLINFQDCIVLDNNLQMLPVNYNVIKTVDIVDESEISKRNKKLAKLKRKLSINHEKLKNIIELCATKDQANSLIDLIKCLQSSMLSKLNYQQPKKEKKISNNIFNHSPYIAMITAGRGRGKSALLGMAIASAINNGMHRIIVTSPSLDNVGTLMQFVVNSIQELGYEENVDFVKKLQTLEGSHNRGIVEIEIFKNAQRQIVKYIPPNQNSYVDSIDLLCLDETAAIPLPIVKKLLKAEAKVVLMSSTIHGYEGTGRSLSLKLMKQVRDEFNTSTISDRFVEISLKEPIRYSQEDNVEKWLNDLLCLDCSYDQLCTNDSIVNYQPSVKDCKLFLVNRDALFSSSAKSEQILQQIMGIYVSSHYKNTPNDLQLLADCSSHTLFCLARPPSGDNDVVIICAVIQVSFEGSIDPVVARSSLEKGIRPSGDMIPWTLVQQFNQYDFVKLAGARIVRIAVHPGFQRQGYGGHALKLLHEFFDRSRDSIVTQSVFKTIDELVKQDATLDSLSYPVRLPPLEKLGNLFINTSDIQAQRLDYIGVSYGLTSELLRFWKKNNFSPVYLRQTMNDSTGEHSCIMLRQLSRSEPLDGQVNWVNLYNKDFNRRFCKLLPGPFRNIDSIMALELLHLKTKAPTSDQTDITSNDLRALFSQSDIIRLDKYIKNMIDYHAIMDLMPDLALLCQTRRFTGLKLPKFQELVLVGLGLQYKSVDKLTEDLVAINSGGEKTTSSSEIMGHLKESVKNLMKVMKPLLK